jgi:cobalt-zinc-cadmium efflux system membrane fusion protein
MKMPWICLGTVCGLVLAGCGSVEKPSVAAEAPKEDPTSIAPQPSLREQLKIGEPAWAMVGTSMTVAARVEVDETRVTRAGSPLMGRITALSVQEGEQVRNGQVLALLNSTGLTDAQLGFLKSLSQRLLAQRAVERAQVLLKADVIGVAELQRREAELQQASAELDAAQDQLTLLGMTPEGIEELRRTRALNSVTSVRAGMDGTVLVRKVTVGQVVQPADTVCEIVDLSTVWLVADVPEQTAGHLTVGTTVEAEIAALPGEKVLGHLSFVSSTVNPETRTVRVRMNLPNPRRLFKPAMLATMVLKEQPQRQRVLPSSAVVREGNDEYVFVQEDANRFRLRAVALGAEVEAGRVLVDGVKPGEKVVLAGAFHLNNERRRRSQRGGGGE